MLEYALAFFESNISNSKRGSEISLSDVRGVSLF